MVEEKIEELLRALEVQKLEIIHEKKRLGLIETEKQTHQICDNEHQVIDNNNKKESLNKPPRVLASPLKEQNPPLPLDLNNSNDGSLERNKQAFIDKIINSENPLTFRSDDKSSSSAMLRYGEYSPNNPQLRYSGAPYLGLGEYEIRRNYLLKKQRQEYLDHLENIKNKENKNTSNCSLEKKVTFVAKAVQTDIQNIHSPLVQYDESYENNDLSSRYLSPRNSHPHRFNTSSVQNALLKPEMDKPKSILSNRRTGSPRERLLADLNHSYTPSFVDGFSYQENATEKHDRERIKRDNYQRELRLQIEEKRHLQSLRDEQERREQELENRRLEQQLLRMQEEQMIEEQRRNRRDELMRRHSEDLLRRKQEMQSRYRKYTESESGVTNIRNTNVASSSSSHYSPPVSRRHPATSFSIPSCSTSVFAADSNPNANPSSRLNSRYCFDAYYNNRKDALNRMDSLQMNHDAHNKLNSFSRFDSLSRIDSLNRQQDAAAAAAAAAGAYINNTTNRIDSLNINQDSSLSNVQRRHSATQQDLSVFRRSPKLSRRSSSSRFDDSLPIPVLKAHSPVAKELKNSIPFASRHSTESLRKLEDKWQIPAVQKNIVNHGDGQSRSILTQLGAIRMQLQQEQLRMDETLRKRGFTQSKAVDFH